MKIIDLAAQPGRVLDQAAALLVDGFEEPSGWQDLPTAREEVARVIREGFARAMLETDTVLGWVGGLPEYAGVDLYGDVPRHIAELRDLGRSHPFPFYRKLGFVVTGVMPDANGPGKPDIYMSQPIHR